MSELINNSRNRKEKLKEILLQIHHGGSTEAVQNELLLSLSQIPYGEVVEVEQELISEGLPEEEILDLCDAHSAVLEGRVDLSALKPVAEGHPVDVFRKENEEIRKLTNSIFALISEIRFEPSESITTKLIKLRGLFNTLYDVDKHYQRKEYLLFPYLEKMEITGPPKVMWGKHDEIRELIKGSIEVLETTEMTKDEFGAVAEIVLEIAAQGAKDMITKEEEILFPMSLDVLTEADWYEISKQSLEIGFCLYDPLITWKPEWAEEQSINESQKSGSHIQLPSGSFSAEEIMTILNTLPVDITFVDKDDKVKYFSQSAERIFQRNRAILNRDVRHCHPPASAHIVDKIIDDFKSGRQNSAPFWINMGGKMIHIEYFALRNDKGEYLGTLEVSHNITPYRELEGEQRILSYK
ncbi:DUF438 domain-containing protein [Flavobacterium sp. UBA6031]|uniref:DUF438 domain-containing protein n=1 Tax=Flavobacterium sp. UBA6031 TaxID=1946551 RepID=UPI0025C20456|nr:DUF438 domain-containing protein [Flavobacterium sp. UBA6031]